MSYDLEFSYDAEDHLRSLTVRQQWTILDAVDTQLITRPLLETKNRKPMRPNPLAPWELWVGNLRVHYDVIDKHEPVVFIRAVGIKLRNQIRIGREVIEL